MQNTGISIPVGGTRAPKDHVFGSVGSVNRRKLVPGGDWRLFSPQGEHQSKFGLETMSCVSQSKNNCHEFIARQRGDVPERNWSDRALAKMSGTTSSGNWLSTVAETARKQGLVTEQLWPWTDPSIDTFDEYYAEIPQNVLSEAAKYLEKYDLPYEWVPTDPKSMLEALEYGPLQVCNDRHAFVVTYGDGKNWYTFDTYGVFVGTLPWDYKFVAAMIHYEVPKEPPAPQPEFVGEEGCSYFVTGGAGRTVFCFAKKMREDDLAKCTDQHLRRNNGFTEGKYRTISEKDLSGVKIYDLKGNEIATNTEKAAGKPNGVDVKEDAWIVMFMRL